MVTFVELASLIGGRWRFHSLEAALPLIRSLASNHWKRCKHWSATLTFQDSGFKIQVQKKIVIVKVNVIVVKIWHSDKFLVSLQMSNITHR